MCSELKTYSITFDKKKLLAQVQIQIRVPLLQGGHELHETLVKVFVRNNLVKIALLGAIFQLGDSILQADFNLLGGFSVTSRESLLEVQD